MPNIRCASIGRLSPARGALRPPVPGEPAKALAQVRKVDPRSPGGLREEARARHPGERICLQAKDVALGAQTEVNPRVATQFQRAMGCQRQLLELARDRRVEARGKNLLR